MKELYICVVKGSEKFRLVSAMYRQNMYAGGRDYGELAPTEIPFSLFDFDATGGMRDEEKYPLARDVNILESGPLKAG